MSDRIVYKGKVYGDTLGTNAALILKEENPQTEDDLDFYIKEKEGEVKEVAIKGGGRASYGNLSGHTIVVQGLKMTFASNMDIAFQNGWIKPTDLYTMFDIDIGFLGDPRPKNTDNEPINVAVNNHYEIKPYNRDYDKTYFYIENSVENKAGMGILYDGTQKYKDTTQLIPTYINCYSNNGRVIGITDGDETHVAYLFPSIVNNSTDNTRFPLYVGDKNHLLTSHNGYCETLNIIPYSYAGIYFLVKYISPTSPEAFWTYDVEENNWTNTKYQNGYAIVEPYFVPMGKIDADKIASNEQELTPEQLGYYKDEKIYFRNAINYPISRYYLITENEKDKIIFLSNHIYYTPNYDNFALGQTNTSNANLGFAIPFANEAERDFALGMTQNLKYLSKEEYEALKNG